MRSDFVERAMADQRAMLEARARGDLRPTLEFLGRCPAQVDRSIWLTVGLPDAIQPGETLPEFYRRKWLGGGPQA